MSANIYDPVTRTLIPYAGNSSSSGGVSNLRELSDVSLSHLSDGQTLIYDATNHVWINSDGGTVIIDQLEDISDVDLTNLTNGQVIVWDATNSTWVNASLPTKTSDLINDSNFVSDANYQHITVDSAFSDTSTNPVQNKVVNSLKETLTNFEESITGEVVDSEPYVLRQGLGNLADMSLVGGSLAWNQLVSYTGIPSRTLDGVTFTNNSDGSFTVNGTASENAIYEIKNTLSPSISANHVYYFAGCPSNGANDTYRLDCRKIGGVIAEEYGNGKIFKANNESISVYFAIRIQKNVTVSNKIFKPHFIDLTQLFGSSTIADYIYSLEQATAGAGVAWFRKYFRNLYYGYDAGSIKSVNPVSRKVVRKNLLPMTVAGIKANNTSGTWNGNIYSIANGTFEILTNGNGDIIGIKANGTFNANAVFQLYPHTKYEGQYILNGCPSGGATNSYWLRLRSSTSGDFNDTGNGVAFNPQSDRTYIAEIVVLNGQIMSNKIFYPMLRLASVTDTTFEPYTEYSYPFDPSIQLRGIPKLVDNKLSYDGDIYTADGTVTRKYGIVDLGTLNWYRRSLGDTYRFSANLATGNYGANAIFNDILCSKYVTNGSVLGSNLIDKVICGYGSQNTSLDVYLRDDNYTDANDLKTSLNGVYLVWKLATPTTESASAYQNPQRAFIDGTEEFVDYGVQSATRDVSIPVGNNTTYQLNETLPPTEDYVDGALKFKVAISALGTDESGRTTASRAYTTGEFFYKDGKMYKVLTSIAQGATFTINTNCQQTTLFAELKALAQ